MDRKILEAESKIMKKKKSSPTFYKVFIQKTYRNNEGYIFMHPKSVDKNAINFEKSFIMIYSFKKIANIHNPMIIIESVKGDDFKGRIRIINHFTENHALMYAVSQDGFYEKLNDIPKKS